MLRVPMTASAAIKHPLQIAFDAAAGVATGGWAAMVTLGDIRNLEAVISGFLVIVLLLLRIRRHVAKFDMEDDE